MAEPTQATIYLSDHRSCSQSDEFRSFHTFNFGTHNHADRMPFGILQVLNDDTLAGNRRLSMRVEQNIDIVLLPIVGTISYKNTLDTVRRDSFGEGGYLEVGQAHVFSAASNISFEITNPYQTDLVNFLQIWFFNRSPTFQPFIHTFSFDLENPKNQLMPLFSTQNKGCEGFIGQFTGRSEGVFKVKNPKNGVFVFIIEGAFEVQNRLLESRDGLALTNVELLEFEALSNDAVLIFIEVPFK